MSWLIKGGTGKLSELEIDTDKDWQQKGITNLKAVAAGMAQGDIAFRGGDILERLPGDYGLGYNFLHIKNTGHLEPEWLDIQELVTYLTGSANRAVSLPSLTITGPEAGFATAVNSSGGEHAAGSELSLSMASMDAPEAESYSPAAVGGAIADDGGVQTEETAEANDPTANDLTLLPALPAVNDAYYFGLSSLWDWLAFNIGQAGAGTWTIVWEYWNGSTWSSLPSTYDTSNGFKNGGFQGVSFHRPADWATSSIMLMDLYWIRARVSAYSSITTQPLGTQAWIGIHT
ncbi:hypothetical protein ACFLY3_00590 [Chloroflexota bacterium]